VKQELVPLQGVPGTAGGFEHMPFIGLHLPATWQPSLAVQLTESVPAHVPATHAYVSHAFGLETAQLPPVTGLGAVHVPVPGWHVPGVLHSGAVHVTGLDPTHAPVWHVYFVKQRFVPVHGVPVSGAGAEHVPVVGLHVPAAWHASGAAGHTTGLDPMHDPA
jgi:hypothetical protein